MPDKYFGLEILKGCLCDCYEDRYDYTQKLKELNKYQNTIYDEEIQRLTMELQQIEMDILLTKHKITNLTDEINGDEYLEWEKWQQFEDYSLDI